MPRSSKPFPFRIEFPPELPISARAEGITSTIATNQVVIIAGETGSGKTTQLPKMCLAAGGGSRGRIACTQPRRVAALSISRRVAEELGVEWGRDVGCKIRFADQTTPQTVIKFLTDGMLLAEMQGDPLLKEYDTIIIDEAHERSLNIDFLIGHLRTLRFRRPELKILITSATIDTAAFSAAFDDAPVVIVEGRTYPVSVIYAPLDSPDDWAGPEAVTPGEEGIDEQGRVAERAAHLAERAEAMHYVDGAAEAVERIVHDGMPGDVLVFLPSERDIREVRDLLEGRRLPNCEIVPLFGRLSNAEQQRVFAPTQRRKVVLATNIAETSLTIPGIRFVVDTGLARMSRYSAQSRTRRLPIEEISQSSADQRKGRSGRVAEGVCIRLYSEKDYLERPRFTQPEIQRANLADVILRMKAFGLGDIERFPFINAPSVKAIRAGYGLLEELGAIAPHAGNGPRTTDHGLRTADHGQRTTDYGPRTTDSRPQTTDHGLRTDATTNQMPDKAGSLGVVSGLWSLTAVGRELARLPVDPTVGRMILQARTEKALREVIVIAAGLSVQDPRERPLDKQAQADAAHRRFAHPDSDFLTLLKIWETYHDEVENLSQGKLRRFCRDHFLSYIRMREWRDIHDQLMDVLRERDEFKLTSVRDGVRQNTGAGGNSARDQDDRKSPSRGKRAPDNADSDPLGFGTPAYRAIHRSVLAGLLGNIATLDEESGLYKATHDRKVVLFPGSVLFRREEPKKRRTGDGGHGAEKKESPDRKRGPKWVMASEIMETSRLYARTCARLDPAWALELGGHIVRVSHSEPFWNQEGGRVMVKQRTRLYGLELENRAVSYGRINPVHATEIFIREALVNDTVTYPLDFLRHNREVREEIEDLLTRARDSGFLNLDEAAYRFYATRLLPEDPSRPVVSSVAELVDLVRERRGAEPRFLMMEPEDLRDPETIAVDAEAFPAALPLVNTALPLNYTYKPGEADDGVTLEVGVKEAGDLTEKDLDWAVPGHLEAKIEHYLRALPKSLRVQLAATMPLAEAAKNLATALGSRDRLTNRRETVAEALAAEIAERFRLVIDPAAWSDKPLPDHLRVRVRVVDERGRELAAGRELNAVRSGLQQHKDEASAAVARAEPEAWRKARAKWETSAQTSWAFGDLPAQVLVTEQAGVPVYAFPGLQVEILPVPVKKPRPETMAPGVAVRLFKSTEEAERATRGGIAALLERELSHELGWLERDLRALREVGPLASTLVTLPELQRHVFESIRRWVTDPDRVVSDGPTGPQTPPTHARGYTGNAFKAAVERAKTDLRGLVPKITELLRVILSARQDLLVTPKPPPWLAAEVAGLLPADFARLTPYGQLAHFPRYLKALAMRVERWRQNPAKDAERQRQVAPYLAAVERLPAGAGREAFRWLVEEFKVSVFAQELGTAEPVSTVKLDRALAALGAGKKAEAPAPAAPKPIVAASVATEKKAPLKNLGALDKLFRR